MGPMRACVGPSTRWRAVERDSKRCLSTAEKFRCAAVLVDSIECHRDAALMGATTLRRSACALHGSQSARSARRNARLGAHEPA